MLTDTYIICDFEWNFLPWRANKICPNEIIEIGAIKTDAALNVIDTFSVNVKPAIYRTLDKRVKRLTRFTEADLEQGLRFTAAMALFLDWITKDQEVPTLCTFGSADIGVLKQNWRFYYPEDQELPWLKRYVNLQEYLDMVENGQQLSLQACATNCGVAVDESSLHQALGDTHLLLAILRQRFDSAKMTLFTIDGNADVLGGSEYITSLGDIDLTKTKQRCPDCGRYLKQLSRWKPQYNRFLALFCCAACTRDYTGRLTVRRHRITGNVQYHSKLARVEDKKAADPAAPVDQVSDH
ncbi:MAG: exonuclease domain-containing protein [Negativicutes bacterium]|nr:exonuclease domain-containing protein [Negativicutes bacterium]